MELTNNILFAFLLTLFAGLSTGIGSAIAFFAKRTNTKLLSMSLGFSAGVMIYVSFIELFPSAEEELQVVFGEGAGTWYTVLAFFGGMLFIALIDKFIPNFENPHEIQKIEDMDDAEQAKKFKKLYRMGIMTALALAIHNLPEGLAAFASALSDPAVGISISIAIAIHNIPEGIAVSVPIYYATGSRKKAFWYSFLSGLSEPVGALIGFLILAPFLNNENMGVANGIILAAVGGIMVFISLDELLPSAEEHGEHHLSIYGLVCGMMVMALSLLVL